MRALVVEDEPTTRLFLVRLMAKYGPCDEAEDGETGVAAFEAALDGGQPYDVVCLDIIMPGIDGNEALAAIRRIEAEKGVDSGMRCRVIMITAAPDAEVLLRGIKGWDAFLVKPVIERFLVEELRRFGLVPA